jgi:hypothetical protein
MPLDRKVKYGSTTSALAGIISGLLVSLLHKHLTVDEIAAIPALVAIVLGWGVAWWTKHAPRDLQVSLRSNVQGGGGGGGAL